MVELLQNLGAQSLKDMLTGRPLDQDSFFTKFASSSAFCSIVGNSNNEGTIHSQQKDPPQRNNGIKKGKSKDIRKINGKASDMPSLVDTNPTKSREQMQEKRKKTKNNCNPIAKKVSKLEE